MQNASLAASIGEDFIRHALDALGGVRQNQLAEDLGIDPRVVSALANARRSVSIERVLEIVGRWNARHSEAPFVVVLTGLPEGVNARPGLVRLRALAGEVEVQASLVTVETEALRKLEEKRGKAFELPDGVIPLVGAIVNASLK
jgi:transcriptional regulator with XRE-family HTH domain